MSNDQMALFEVDENWKKDWQDMPEFNNKDITSFQSILVHFKNKEDLNKFAELIGIKLTYRTQYMWYPPIEMEVVVNKRYVDAEAPEIETTLPEEEIPDELFKDTLF